MEQIKLRDLYEACKREMKAGNGNKYLIAPSDNEGNWYHGVFFTLTPINEENKDCFEGQVLDSTEANLENCIVVG